ncbi:MAG: 4-hydroxy-tetrahydrodipicolinate synthase [Cyanobacteriota bacterium ELA615]|jgi:4-hydroxy-tetrahydrodipicolinate synthase
MHFGQVITAMVTPFDEQGEVSYAVAESLADYLISNGSDGIVVCGTTGESPTLSWEEEYQLFQVVKNAVGSRAKVIAGTGSNCTNEAVYATQKAAALGVDGSLQVVPYYNRPPQDGLYEHFRTIATAVPQLPIMLYNIPTRTGQNLLPETAAKLAQIDNIVAIKEASGNLEQAAQIRRLSGNLLDIYAGDDALTLPMLAVGGVGIVSVASHLVGNQIKQMIGSFLTGNIEQAEAINTKYLPLFKALFCTTNPIAVKAALNLQGWNVGGVRLPLVALSQPMQADLEKVLQELL